MSPEEIKAIEERLEQVNREREQGVRIAMLEDYEKSLRANKGLRIPRVLSSCSPEMFGVAEALATYVDKVESTPQAKRMTLMRFLKSIWPALDGYHGLNHCIIFPLGKLGEPPSFKVEFDL